MYPTQFETSFTRLALDSHPMPKEWCYSFNAWHPNATEQKIHSGCRRCSLDVKHAAWLEEICREVASDISLTYTRSSGCISKNNADHPSNILDIFIKSIPLSSSLSPPSNEQNCSSLAPILHITNIYQIYNRLY